MTGMPPKLTQLTNMRKQANKKPEKFQQTVNGRGPTRHQSLISLLLSQSICNFITRLLSIYRDHIHQHTKISIKFKRWVTW